MRMEGESGSCRAQARHADEACRAGLALVNCDQPHSDHPLSSLNCLAHNGSIYAGLTPAKAS